MCTVCPGPRARGGELGRFGVGREGSTDSSGVVAPGEVASVDPPQKKPNQRHLRICIYILQSLLRPALPLIGSSVFFMLKFDQSNLNLTSEGNDCPAN